jgi:hypothetical protein
MTTVVPQHRMSSAHCCRTHVSIYINVHLHYTTLNGLSLLSLFTVLLPCTTLVQTA